MADWPESERPIAFIYEEIDYPEEILDHAKTILEKL